MLTYLLIAGALFVVCATASSVGLTMYGAALFPIPIGMYAARGQRARALGLAAFAVPVAAVAMEPWAAMVYYLWMALAGLVLGTCIARGWTYVRALAAGMAIVLGAALAEIVAMWPLWVSSCREATEAFMTTVSAQAEGANRENVLVLLRYLTWMRDHWPEIGLGLTFWTLLVHVCAALSLMQAWARRKAGTAGLRDWFGAIRLPDGLVWVAIVLALLWFLDHGRPGAVSRVLVWNGALVLMAVYWLAGLAVVAYWMRVLRPHAFVMLAAVLLMMSLWVHPMLCMVGLFDTWGDFRRVADQLAAARKKRDEELGQPGGDE